MYGLRLGADVLARMAAIHAGQEHKHKRCAQRLIHAGLGGAG